MSASIWSPSTPVYVPGDVSVTPQQFLAAGESVSADAGPAIRRALASGYPVRFPAAEYIVNYDPASAFDDAGTTRYSYSVSVPSNAVLIMQEGAKIKQADGVQNWNRTLVFINVTGVKVFGECYVDGNVANIGASTNEHMHGVFVYNSEVKFEALRSENARGDNVFIGGDSEVLYSDVTIDRLNCKTAGRKNLVQHMADVKIGIAYLDNSSGGASLFGGVPDTTDKHSLDVEPDTFTGARRFVMSIGQLYTRGSGNDFTAGTTPAAGDNWLVKVGVFESVITAATSSVYAWEQNAITVECGSLSITGINSSLDTPVKLNYAARLKCGKIKISGNTGAAQKMMSVAASGGDANFPKLTCPDFEISNSNATGLGLHCQTSQIQLGLLEGTTGGELFTYSGNASVVEQGSYIEHLSSIDCGVPTTGYVATVTRSNALIPNVTFGKITVRDTRGTKAAGVLNVASGCAAQLCVKELNNIAGLATPYNWAGTDKFVRLAGSPGAVGFYQCTGTPLGMITASPGSFALRSNGGASTSVYVKESATDATGWVPK